MSTWIHRKYRIYNQWLESNRLTLSTHTAHILFLSLSVMIFPPLCYEHITFSQILLSSFPLLAKPQCGREVFWLQGQLIPNHMGIGTCLNIHVIKTAVLATGTAVSQQHEDQVLTQSPCGWGTAVLADRPALSCPVEIGTNTPALCLSQTSTQRSLEPSLPPCFSREVE